MEPDDNKPIHTISTDITPNYGPQMSDISSFPVGNCQQWDGTRLMGGGGGGWWGGFANFFGNNYHNLG
jgi:hypothetical protein